VLRDWRGTLDEAVAGACKDPKKIPALMKRAFMYLIGSVVAKTPRSARLRKVVKWHYTRPKTNRAARRRRSASIQFFINGAETVLHKPAVEVPRARVIHNRGVSKESWWWGVAGGKRGAIGSRGLEARTGNRYAESFTPKGGSITLVNRLKWIDEIVPASVLREAEQSAARRFLFANLARLVDKEITAGAARGARNTRTVGLKIGI